jgi:hypothetical protein
MPGIALAQRCACIQVISYFGLPYFSKSQKRMKIFATSFLFLIIASFVPDASAFGPTGHKIVVNIAMQYLSPAAKKNVLRILGNIKPDSAATWMDNMREYGSYDYMKPWHFINIDSGKAYKPGINNIIWELERVYAQLQHPEMLKTKARKEALMILFHLMGDLHQPLHVGYGSDRGGNETQIQHKGFKTDLHHIWDSDIIWNQHITTEACLKLSKTTAKEIADKQFAATQFVAYMKESRALLPKVYAFTGGNIDNEYMISNKQVVMLQLLRAGQRLAGVLQQLFGTA